MKNLILFLIGFLIVFFAQAQVTNYGVGSGTQGISSSYFGENAGSMNMNSTRGNTFIGTNSGQATDTGGFNTFVGAISGRYNTDGTHNTFVGMSAGHNNTEGRYNTFIGLAAGRYNTEGIFNTIIGTYAGGKNEKGCCNVYIGTETAYENVNGKSNVFIGYHAGRNDTNSYKLHIANNQYSSLIYGDFTKKQVIIGYVKPNTLAKNLHQDYKLGVLGKLIAEEVRVTPQVNWPDYVFAKDYTLTPLNELENQIQELGHLPNIPAAEEVEAEGFELGAMNAKLLEKVEELTLYLIELNKEVQQLKKENQILKGQNQK